MIEFPPFSIVFPSSYNYTGTISRDGRGSRGCNCFDVLPFTLASGSFCRLPSDGEEELMVHNLCVALGYLVEKHIQKGAVLMQYSVLSLCSITTCEASAVWFPVLINRSMFLEYRGTKPYSIESDT